ncbi:hypothetical protein ACGFS9_14950 [Streptomyces sp. NPDC048566]|uniref:hypothetical protein n=1 Tax=Streptomyces sp. NPDC048566 TaxID=3365569 RepID=UPI00371AF5F2
MPDVEGLRVTVQGDLPRPVMERIAATVRQAVLEEVATLDIAPRLREWPLAEPETPAPDAGDPFGGEQDSWAGGLGILLGIVLKPESLE